MGTFCSLSIIFCLLSFLIRKYCVTDPAAVNTVSKRMLSLASVSCASVLVFKVSLRQAQRKNKSRAVMISSSFKICKNKQAAVDTYNVIPKVF